MSLSLVSNPVELPSGFMTSSWEQDSALLELATKDASPNTHPLTGGGRLASGLVGLQCRTPVARRPLAECLDKEGGSRMGEKIFVLKLSEELLKA